ncbi:MAG: leucine-rich repeat domain-containing protein [Clostridiales bacterium]|nr:leucine-rich repeat domain-containing protein [Clostridiales bacterium]
MPIGENNTNPNRITELLGVDCRSVMMNIEDIYNSKDTAKSKAAKIGKIISSCINKKTDSTSSHTDGDFDDVECIGEGSSSICLRATKTVECKQYIIKLFRPRDLYEEIVLDAYYETAPNFVWLSNRATEVQADRFLERFHRFIKQKDNIEKSRGAVVAESKNPQFIDPSIRLTSHGFAYIANAFSGVTVEEDLKLSHVAPNSSGRELQELLYRIRLIRKTSENVQKFCHANTNKVFHGDIKPDNFYIIRDRNVDNYDYDYDIVQTIDFDTWISEEDFNNGYAKRMATTPLFYFDIDRVSKNQTIDQWLSFDVTALSRMLIYSLLDVFSVDGNCTREKSNLFALCQNETFNWIKFFFKTDSAERLYNVLCADKSIAGLYVFNYIKTILIQCSEFALGNSINRIEELIDRLRCGEVLIGTMLGDDRETLNFAEMRHARFIYKSLCVLDKEIGNRFKEYLYVDASKVLLANLVEKRINELYYDDVRCYDRIDRRLIPDIDLGSNRKPLAYKFDDKGDPISKSPLEQALEKVNDKSLFLTAEGGQGKTTTLRSFWLDFLSGKHRVPCLYIDCKLLKNENNAIKEYIGNEYRLNIDKLVSPNNKPIILLDGVNESNTELRDKQGNGVCSLVSECQGVLEKESFRIVIGSRSKIITTIEKEDEKNYSSSKKNSEFGDAVFYATVCELRGNQIEHCLTQYNFNKNEITPSLIQLLRNNMMLYIFTHVSVFEKIQSQDITAGKLLDMYFSICFKVRYVKRQASLQDSEEYVYMLMKENSDLLPNEKRKLRDIKDKLQTYERIFEYFVAHSMQDKFTNDELNEYFEDTGDKLCEISILKKIDDNKYTWANEIYQEYCQALMLKQALEKMYKNEFNLDDVNMVMDLYGDEKYKVLQYAGELISREYSDFNEMVVNVRNTKISIDNDDVDDCVSGIVVISVLSENGIPYNVTTIEDYAFADCRILTKIKIPEGVTAIGQCAFSGCSNLTSIEIPNSVTGIASYAFLGCSGLTSIEMPDNIMRVGNNVFDGCSGLTHLKISSRIVHGEEFTFRGSNRQLFQVENGVCYLDKWVVGAIKPVSSVELRYGTVGIWAYAFRGCSRLTSIAIPNSVTIIGDNAFHGCTKLTNVEIPDSVTSIGYSAFYNCKNAIKILIGSGIKDIVEIPNDPIVEDGEDDPIILLFDEEWDREHSEPFCGCVPKTIIMPRRLYTDFKKLFGHEDDGSAEVILIDD